MKLHFLVEGVADRTFLEQLLPRLIPKHSWQVYPHQGRGKLPNDPTKTPDKRQFGLLDNLPAKLRAWGKSLNPATDRVVVVIDQDNDDCKDLLARLHKIHKAIDPRPVTIFRLAIEETEAWYLGDAKAVKKAFVKVKSHRLNEWKPDTVGRTWELFQEVVNAPTEDKVGWGEVMGKVLTVEEPLEAHNRSPSFCKFCRRVREHAGDPAVGPKARRRSAVSG